MLRHSQNDGLPFTDPSGNDPNRTAPLFLELAVFGPCIARHALVFGYRCFREKNRTVTLAG